MRTSFLLSVEISASILKIHADFLISYRDLFGHAQKTAQIYISFES